MLIKISWISQKRGPKLNDNTKVERVRQRKYFHVLLKTEEHYLKMEPYSKNEESYIAVVRA